MPKRASLKRKSLRLGEGSSTALFATFRTTLAEELEASTWCGDPSTELSTLSGKCKKNELASSSPFFVPSMTGFCKSDTLAPNFLPLESSLKLGVEAEKLVFFPIFGLTALAGRPFSRAAQAILPCEPVLYACPVRSGIFAWQVPEASKASQCLSRPALCGCILPAHKIPSRDFRAKPQRAPKSPCGVSRAYRPRQERWTKSREP